MAREERVLVVGAGIGGLAAAAALAQRGFDVELVERKPEFAASGVGLGQPANALRALRAIGVLDEVIASGFEFDRFRLYDYRGELIVDHGFPLGDARTPAVVALPRADIHGILRAAVRDAGVAPRMGTTVAGFSQEPGAVEVTFDDGSAHRFDFVLGFDGVGSSTRRLVCSEACEPVYSGYAAWRLIVDRPEQVTCLEFYQGLGSKTGVMPLNERQMYLFHIRPEPGNPWQDSTRLDASLRERLVGYGGVTADVRDSLTPSSPIVYSPIEVLLVPSPWYRGRVIIGGDAAHTVPPHFTQGAGMALEDAIVLAEELAREAPLAERLDAVMRRRFERCRFVSDFATRMLRDEQAIVSEEQLERARQTQFGGLDGRLVDGYEFMNQAILRMDEPPLRASTR